MIAALQLTAFAAIIVGMGEVLAEFTVYGKARPAGSKNAFVHPHTKKIVMTDSAGAAGREWRGLVQAAALPHFARPLEGAMVLDVTFYRVRPKSHYGSGRNANCVKDSAPAHPTTVPDVDKTCRLLNDALTGIAWRDDSQVVTMVARKRYAERDHMDVRIELADAQSAVDLALSERLPLAA